MPDIYAYLDYREFLKEYYASRKRASRVFSYKSFANKAGFKTKSFLKMVIDGKKNLSEDSLAKVAAVLKLDGRALSYFEDLVAYNQAKSLKLRNQLLEKLLIHRVEGVGRLIPQAQYEFYSQWHHNTLRELLPATAFGGDYDALGALLTPAISGKDARKSVELMLRLGLLEKDDDGGFKQTDPIITTGDQVISMAVQNFHMQNFLLAAKSLEECPPVQRDLSALVVKLSGAGFRLFRQEIQALRKRLLKLSESDKGSGRVYHVAFQMYPTTKELP